MGVCVFFRVFALPLNDPTICLTPLEKIPANGHVRVFKSVKNRKNMFKTGLVLNLTSYLVEELSPGTNLKLATFVVREKK